MLKVNTKLPPPTIKCRDCKWYNKQGCWFLTDKPTETVAVKPNHGCNQGRKSEFKSPIFQKIP